MTNLIKRALVGPPMRSEQVRETLLPKRLALPVFCSDPISSVAYASEQVLVVLALGGALYLQLATPVAAAVVVVLAVVVLSYRNVCHAYPTGGGAFVVSKDNLGEGAALVAASALLVDYTMTVAVSVASGVVAATSALPTLGPYAVPVAVAFIAALALANLRGARQSGRVSAIPTYSFVALALILLLVAVVRSVGPGLPPAESASMPLPPAAGAGTMFTMLLVLRAFASGCTALTGVEAITNGVPHFRKPKAHNAATTLLIMGGIAITLFGGVSVLASALGVRPDPDGSPSVLAQIASSVFGASSAPFYAFQAATAAILVLAANTAFSGFPVLASMLSADGYLPRQLRNRGDRLVHSNGIILLAGFAALIVVVFEANVESLIQLYIVGVFTSFTLSQTGMVRYWQRRLAEATQRNGIRRAQALSAIGALLTGIVLVVVLITKITHGAWIAVLAMAVLFIGMRSTNRYYRRFEREISVAGQPAPPPQVHAVVLISRLHKPATHAIAFARATRPDSIEAIHVATDEQQAEDLREEWRTRGISTDLQVLESPYRSLQNPVIRYVNRLRRQNPSGVVSVFIPEYVVRHWWQNLLHNQTALRLKAQLRLTPGVVVVDVPYHLGTEQGWLADGAQDEPEKT